MTPAALFAALQRLAPDAIYTTDSGNGTFLAMEHLRLDEPGPFLAPVDFSCMGYAVPAAIGAKLANPDRDVVALAGDGAFLMTGLELLTAARPTAPRRSCACCATANWRRSPSSSARPWRTPRNSVLPPYDVEAFAQTVGAGVRAVPARRRARGRARARPSPSRARGRPVIVDVAIDYSRKTYFTRGVVDDALLAAAVARAPPHARPRRVAAPAKRLGTWQGSRTTRLGVVDSGPALRRMETATEPRRFRRAAAVCRSPLVRCRCTSPPAASRPNPESRIPSPECYAAPCTSRTAFSRRA